MSTEIGQISVSPKTLGVALKEKGLWVPPNQRDYAWEKEHIDDLFDDFMVSIRNNSPEYFLGSIVVIYDKKTKTSMVVDGQQRLATTMILLAAIRDYYHLNSDQQGASLISGDFLTSLNRTTRLPKPHFRLNETDHSYFENRILVLPDDARRRALAKPEKPSHILIDKAAKNMAKHIKDLLQGENESNRLAVLEGWIAFIEGAAKAMWVEVPDESSAYKIFETMNDRGLALSANDLIKNYLLATVSKENLEQIKVNWITMNNTLDTVTEKEIAKTFIRHFWISRFGRVRNNEIFDGIKIKYKNEASVLSLSGDLVGRSLEYVAIATPSHALWTKTTNEYRHIVPKSIQSLKTLGVTQMRPLFLSALQKLPPKEVSKLFQSSVSWAVRLIIAGRLGTGTLEGLYGDLSLAIMAGTLKTASDIATFMKKEVPDNGVFQKAFEIATVSQSSIARYYLRCLEMQNKGEAEPYFTPNENPLEISLEHIMPQEPEGKWSHIPKEVFASHTKRIGNLALLRASDNSGPAANDEFDIKQPILADHNGYELTKLAAKATKWDKDEIESRQKALAQLAVKTWPL